MLYSSTLVYTKRWHQNFARITHSRWGLSPFSWHKAPGARCRTPQELWRWGQVRPQNIYQWNLVDIPSHNHKDISNSKHTHHVYSLCNDLSNPLGQQIVRKGILCSGVSYFLINPPASNKCMLLVLIVVVSLNFLIKPSASAIAIFSSESKSSKWTFVSVLCSRKSYKVNLYQLK